MSYVQSAELYDLIYATRKDYARESQQLREIVARETNRASGKLLDVGCGTGLHAVHLARWFEVEGLDSSAEMLRVARARRPLIQFHEGDMRSFELGKKYDVIVSLFGAVGHLGSLIDLRLCAERFKKHGEPGGLVIIEPWYLPGRWESGGIETNFIPSEGVLRVVETKAEGRTAKLAMHYFVGWPSAVRYFRADHELMSWSKEEFVSTFGTVGINLSFIERGLTSRGLFIGRMDDA